MNRPYGERMRGGRITLFVGLILLATWTTAVQAGVPVGDAKTPAVALAQQSIDVLRTDLATDFGNPVAHLALAKALNEQGSALTAFLISENARALFGEDSFFASYQVVFRDGMTDIFFHARRHALQSEVNHDPRNVKALTELAKLDAAHGDFDEAVFVAKRARDLSPQDFSLVTLLQSLLISSGNRADADQLLSDWCRDHPETAPAWERRVTDQLSQDSDAASATLDEALAKYPDEGPLHLMRAKLEADAKPDDAQAEYIAAANFAPDSAAIQAAAGHYFANVHHDPERALKYYLAAYFLDPNLNDWESVDQRIRDAGDEVTQARMAEVKAAGGSLDTLLADQNPFVQTTALTLAMANKGDYLPQHLLKLTSADCPDVRDAAIALLASHPTWLSAEKVAVMLKSDDAWTRAAGALIIGGRRNATVDPLMPLLGDPTVLVRLSAATALLGEGSEGRRIVNETLHKEPVVWLRTRIFELEQKGGSR